MNQLTTLKYVDIEINDHIIVLDYHRLYDYIANKRKDRDFEERLNMHIKGLCSLESWTIFTSQKYNDDDMKVVIRRCQSLL